MQRCENCRSADVFEINLTGAAGEPLHLTSCRGCEHRTWTDANGAPVASLAKALTAA